RRALHRRHLATPAAILPYSRSTRQLSAPRARGGRAGLRRFSPAHDRLLVLPRKSYGPGNAPQRNPSQGPRTTPPLFRVERGLPANVPGDEAGAKSLRSCLTQRDSATCTGSASHAPAGAGGAQSGLSRTPSASTTGADAGAIVARLVTN